MLERIVSWQDSEKQVLSVRASIQWEKWTENTQANEKHSLGMGRTEVLSWLGENKVFGREGLFGRSLLLEREGDVRWKTNVAKEARACFRVWPFAFFFSNLKLPNAILWISYVFSLPPWFCQRMSVLWTQNLSYNQLTIAQNSSQIRPKID